MAQDNNFFIGQTVVVNGETYKITNVYQSKTNGKKYYELDWDFTVSEDFLCLELSKK